MRTEHILIIRFSALGDVAMTVPVVYSLARQYPHVRFTMLSKPFARPFFENLAPNVGFMEANLNTEYHGVKGLNALYRRLAAKHFTAIADLHNVLRSEYLRMRFNIDNYHVAHINKHRKEKQKLIKESNQDKKQLNTSFENYTEVFEKLGYPVTLDFQSIFPPEGGPLRQISEQIGEKKSFQQWIGIAPFAAHKGKILPLEKIVEVTRQITDNHPSCRIFFFGGGGQEKEMIDSVIEKFPTQCINASQQLNGLQQELILMSHLDVMISMDSANMHLASLTNTPVVSIWGSTHPYAGFMGWNQKSENAVQVKLPCRPCSIYGNKPCQRGDYACLNMIDPKDIVQKVEDILNCQ